MSTVKYIAYKNNLKVNIDERLGERIHGIIPKNLNIEEFELNQLKDENYKLVNGENQKEVRTRMTLCIKEIINNNQGKNIFICTHNTAITFFLLNYCKIKYDTKELYYKDKAVFDFNWGTPKIFELIYDDDNQLISIDNIRSKYGIL